MVPTYVEPVHPDLVIVPMLAFNPMTLHRVGYGGGYYDRTMAAYRRDGSKTLFVGLATEDLKCHELKA
jgi:5-formyltetrahydrofolate cyclo-ligase